MAIDIRAIANKNGGLFANMESDLKARIAEARENPDPERVLLERYSRGYPHWKITQEIGTGIWYRECTFCGSITQWRHLDRIPVSDNCLACSIPFEGEPNSRPF